MTLNPVIKWAGGKRHIAQSLADKAPSQFQTYFEPFIGGAAFFLHLNHRPSVVGDINVGLTTFYEVLRDMPGELISQIRSFAESFDAADDESKSVTYYEVRNIYNANRMERIRTEIDFSSKLENARNFYILNKLAFNGLYRENRKGFFKVPFNGRKSFPSVDERRFRDVAGRLSAAKILTADFDDVVGAAVEGDFVYFDPPYVPLTPTSSFTSYSESGFGLADQKRLAKCMSELTKKGVKAMLSNSATPLSREIYSEFQIEELEAPRAISSKASTRGSVTEILVRNYS
jgi:DNA adenine methylase